MFTRKDIMKKITALFLCISLFPFICSTNPVNADTSTSVYQYITFDEPSLPLIIESNDNTLSVESQNGNSYLHAKKNVSERGLFIHNVNVSDTDNFIVHYSIKLVDSNSFFQICQFKDTNGNWSTNVEVNNGILKAKKGKKQKKISSSWEDMSFVFNIPSKTFSVYFGNTVFESNIPWEYTNLSDVCEIRFTMPSTPGKIKSAELFIDNYYVYSGTVPRKVLPSEMNEYPPLSVLPSEKNIRTSLKNYTALHTKSNVIYKNDKKFLLSDPIENLNGVIMVTTDDINLIFDINTSVCENKVYINEKNFCTVDSDKMQTENGLITLDHAVSNINGKIYLPLQNICKDILKLNLYRDNSCINGGMYIIGNSLFTPPQDTSSLQELNNFLFFQRPEQYYFINKLASNGYKNVHPRLFITENSLNNLKSEIASGSIKKNWADSTVKYADSVKDISVPEYGTYDGTRMDASPAYYAMLLSMAFLLTDDISYKDAAWAKLRDICSYEDWNPDKQFLNTAEIALNVATAYDWLYNFLTPDQRKTIERALYEKAIVESKKWWYGLKGTRDKWQVSESNWNAVCNGGIAVAALAILDVYENESAEIISLCTRGLEYIAKRFVPDGNWFEGPAYWEYTFRHYIKYLSAFETVYGNCFSLDLCDGLDTAAEAVIYQQTDLGSFNYADADVENIYPPSLYWLAAHYKNPSITNLVLSKTDYKVSEGVNSPFALIWLKLSGNETADLPLDKTFGGDGAVSIMREGFEKNDTYVGIKAGRAKYSHSHLDLGSFIYESSGIRWALDMGKDNYNLPGYWDSNNSRWKALRLRAEGHNTIIINPDGSGIDQNLSSKAEIIRTESSDDSAITVVDMSEALSKNVSKAIRGYYLTDHRKSLVVRDEFSLLNSENTIHWFMYTPATQAEINDKTVTLSYSGRQLRCEFMSNLPFTLNFEDAKPLEGSPHVSGENNNKDIKRIHLTLSGGGNANITVKLSPVAEKTSSIKDYDANIDNWTTSKLFNYDFNDYAGENTFIKGNGTLGPQPLIAEASQGFARSFDFGIGGKSSSDISLLYNVYPTENEKTTFFGPYTNSKSLNWSYYGSEAFPSYLSVQWNVYDSTSDSVFEIVGKRDPFNGVNHYSYSNIKIPKNSWHTITAEFSRNSLGSDAECTTKIFIDDTLLYNETTSDDRWVRYPYLYIRSKASDFGIIAIDDYSAGSFEFIPCQKTSDSLFEYDFNDYSGENTFMAGNGIISPQPLIAESGNGYSRTAKSGIGGNDNNKKSLVYTVSPDSRNDIFFGFYYEGQSIHWSYYGNVYVPTVTAQWRVFDTTDNGTFEIRGKRDPVSGYVHYCYPNIAVTKNKWHTIALEMTRNSISNSVECVTKIYLDGTLIGYDSTYDDRYMRFPYLYFNSNQSAGGMIAIDDFRIVQTGYSNTDTQFFVNQPAIDLSKINDGIVSASVYTQNTLNMPKNVTLYLAAYKGARLQDIKVVSKTVLGSETITGNLIIPYNNSALIYKAFVLDENIHPLSSIITSP